MTPWRRGGAAHRRATPCAALRGVRPVREVPIDILPDACRAGQDVEIQPDTQVLDFPLKSSR